MFILAHQVKKTKPGEFFKKAGFKDGVPSGFRHWLCAELKTCYKTVQPKASEHELNCLTEFCYKE